MNTPEEITRLRMGLSHAVGYLKHFKEDAECNLVSYPDRIQRAIDDLQAVLDGGNAGDVYRRAFDFRGEVPAIDRTAQFR